MTSSPGVSTPDVSLEVVLLGTGSPMPSADRCGAGQVIVGGEACIVVDLGWGTARRLVAARLSPASITALCFTHLHSDHISDTTDFLTTRWTQGASQPLRVFGPPGTKKMIDAFLEALAADTASRLALHRDRLSLDGMRCEVQEIAPQGIEPITIGAIGEVQVRAFAVSHPPMQHALGYRFDRSARSVVLSGDTLSCNSLALAARGANVLICAVQHPAMVHALRSRLQARGRTLESDSLGKAETCLMSVIDAAALAQSAGVQRLVFTHLIPPIAGDGSADETFLTGVAERFDGEAIVGRDLDRIVIA